MALLKFLSAVLSCGLSLAEFVNVDVAQTVRVTEPYIRRHFDIKAQNTAGSEPAWSYGFLIPEADQDVLATVSVHAEGVELDTVATGVENGYIVCYARFETAVQAAQEIDLTLDVVLSVPPKPFPESAKQSDEQFLLYEGATNLPSPYSTQHTVTRIPMTTKDVAILHADGTTTKPKVESKTVVFTSDDIAPFTAEDVALRFLCPLPMPRIQKLERTVWISHWGGTVSVDESYDLQNVGTAVEYPFSRQNFRLERGSTTLNAASVRAVRIGLPDSHREEYYVDLVGNVSTSVVRRHELEVLPRYPLMGGWFYNFTVGWASDLAEFVREVSPSNYVLAVPVVDGPKMVGYGGVHNKIVLPEGAHVIDVFTEVPCDDITESVTYSYLDLHGRPTLELHYTNLVSEMSEKKVFVSYHYPQAVAFRKPVSYALAIFTVLFTVRALTR